LRPATHGISMVFQGERRSKLGARNMSFGGLLNDKVTLIKANGDRHPNISASVQSTKIFIDDASFSIEVGDVIERTTSNGMVERYSVVDPGFYESVAGMNAHYQVRVRRSDVAHSVIAEPAPSPSGLHPWGVLLSVAFDLKGDEIVTIISATGLSVDFNLSGKEAFSDLTRKRAYRQRVDKSFLSLSSAEKLRVAWLLTREMLVRYPEKEGELSQRLSAIGWKIEETKLSPSDRKVDELFFPERSEHDAYVELRGILNSATRSIFVTDPYLDSSILTLLATCKGTLAIRLLGHKFPVDFKLEANRFMEQYATLHIELRRSREFHDRFIVLDNTKCYHVGASIKDAGNRAFMINELNDASNVEALLQQIEKSWNAGEPA
jgi:hypothetical protein